MSAPTHAPVMAREVVESLAPQPGAVYVDGTFGAGGYATALLEAAPCVVWGIDRDPRAVAAARDLVARYAGRLDVLCGRFGEMARLLRTRDVRAVDGVALDLGISSVQLDDPGRGFSFRHDGPLDMRLDGAGPTAADAVNTLDEDALADLIHAFGEERAAKRIARAIVERRRQQRFTRTGELADLVRRVVPRARDGIDPATRTFQALRLYVNDELGELDRGMENAESLLRPGGRLAVVSFHSLEDRRVKRFLADRIGAAPRPSRHRPESMRPQPAPSFQLLHRGARRPSADEIAANPRARSARLRAAERTAAPAWPAAAEAA